MTRSWTSRKLSLTTGSNHQKGRGSASNSDSLFPFYIVFYNCHGLLINYFWSVLVTPNPNTSSKQCAKVVQLDQESLEFLACPSCKYFLKLVSQTGVPVLKLCYSVFHFRHDFQFFNTQRLSELYEKEVRYLMVGNVDDILSYSVSSLMVTCPYRY